MKATALLVLALVAVALAATSPFDGQWTDKSGFDHDAYFCGDAQTNEFYGTYSEVGLLIGTLSNRGSKASGTWYQAGLGKCTTGSFEIVLSESGNSFSGSYSCSESPEIVIPWVETRISRAIPSDIQCGRLATRESEDARGKWLFGDFSWDVCVRDDAVYQSSYNFAVEGSTSSVTDDDDQMATINVGQGYESGQLFEKNKIMKGFYIENDGSQGVTLEFRVAGRQIVGFFWCTSSPYEHANAKDFDVCHSVEIYDKIGTEKDCNRYTKLWPKGQQRPVNDPNNSFDLQIGSSDVGTFSSSVREVASMVVVCVAVLIALMF